MDPLEQLLLQRQQIPDPNTYAQAELDRPLEEFPGAKTGQVDLGLYSSIKGLLGHVAKSRPAAALWQQLNSFKAPLINEADAAGTFAASRISRYQPPKVAVKAPEGFTVPRANQALPKDPVARRVIQERQALKEMQAATKPESYSSKLNRAPAPPSASGYADLNAAATAASKSGAIRRFTPEQIAEMNQQLLANAPKITKPTSTVLSKNPEILNALEHKGTKTLSQLARELKVNRSYLSDIARRNGIPIKRGGGR